jgi:hypothetical protein
MVVWAGESVVWNFVFVGMLGNIHSPKANVNSLIVNSLATTGRYLLARPATDQVGVFTRAFESRTPVEALDG